MANRPVTTSQPPIPRNQPGALAHTPIPTPTHGPGGSFSIIASQHIAAPPDTVFAALLSHPTWPSWNRFVRRVTVLSAPPPPSSPPSSSSSSALEAAIATDDGSKYIKKGTKMTFEVHMNPDDAKSSINQNMEVTLLEPFDSTDPQRGWRVAWKGTSIPSLVLRTERVQEFVSDGEGGTEYTCWETMYGPLAPVVRLTQGAKLESGFEAWGVDLKKRAEEIAREERSGGEGAA